MEDLPSPGLLVEESHVAPVGLTLLGVRTGGWGWWVVAALFLGCAVSAGPAVGWVARTPRLGGQASSGPAAAGPEAGTAAADRGGDRGG